jgi:hypothetical protein
MKEFLASLSQLLYDAMFKNKIRNVSNLKRQNEIVRMAFCKEVQLKIKVFAWNPLKNKKTCHKEHQSGRNKR